MPFIFKKFFQHYGFNTFGNFFHLVFTVNGISDIEILEEMESKGEFSCLWDISVEVHLHKFYGFRISGWQGAMGYGNIVQVTYTPPVPAFPNGLHKNIEIFPSSGTVTPEFKTQAENLQIAEVWFYRQEPQAVKALVSNFPHILA